MGNEIIRVYRAPQSNSTNRTKVWDSSVSAASDDADSNGNFTENVDTTGWPAGDYYITVTAQATGRSESAFAIPSGGGALTVTDPGISLASGTGLGEFYLSESGAADAPHSITFSVSDTNTTIFIVYTNEATNAADVDPVVTGGTLTWSLVGKAVIENGGATDHRYTAIIKATSAGAVASQTVTVSVPGSTYLYGQIAAVAFKNVTEVGVASPNGRWAGDSKQATVMTCANNSTIFAAGFQTGTDNSEGYDNVTTLIDVVPGDQVWMGYTPVASPSILSVGPIRYNGAGAMVAVELRTSSFTGIAQNNWIAYDYDGANTGSNLGWYITTGAPVLLVATYTREAGDVAFVSPTISSVPALTWHQGPVATNGSYAGAEVWWAWAATPQDYMITAATTGASSGANLNVIALSGAQDPTGLVANTHYRQATNNGTGTEASVTMTTIGSTGSWIIAAGCAYDSTNLAPLSGTTFLHDPDGGSWPLWGARSGPVSAGSHTIGTSNNTSTSFAVAAMEVLKAT